MAWLAGDELSAWTHVAGRGSDGILTRDSSESGVVSNDICLGGKRESVRACHLALVAPLPWVTTRTCKDECTNWHKDHGKEINAISTAHAKTSERCVEKGKLKGRSSWRP